MATIFFSYFPCLDFSKMVGCTHCLLLFNFPSIPQRCDVHPHLSTETVLAKVIWWPHYQIQWLFFKRVVNGTLCCIWHCWSLPSWNSLVPWPLGQHSPGFPWMLLGFLFYFLLGPLLLYLPLQCCCSCSSLSTHYFWVSSFYGFKCHFYL